MLIFRAMLLKELIALLEQKPGLFRRFAARCAMSERLDVLALAERDPGLQLRAAELIGQLEAADARFFQRVQARLRRGMFTRAGMIDSLWRYAEREDASIGYAPLDVLLAGVFDAGELPEELPRSAEMVAYQPAPGRVILSLLRELRAGDTFFDLGSGLGRVLIAAALFAGVRAKGVEFQPSFCAYAARAAQAVNAREVELIALDAREAPLADGDVFFLYTPFRGALLQSVLSKLRAIAALRPIRVCTFGPCTSEVASATWLELQRGRLDPNELAVFVSC